MTVQTVNSPHITDVRASEAWSRLPANFELNDGEADVWLASLDAGNTFHLEKILSADERARAARFRFEADKKHFVAARAFLRLILGKYLQTDPHRIFFDYNEYGKPAIGGEDQSNIKFNVSHSGGLALFAFARRREIGVDIERINASFADEAAAREFLTTREIERFRALSRYERERFFFDCWTRKEALVKACGKGLSLAANRIETAAFGESSAALPENDGEFPQALWSVHRLPQISGFAAALAIEGERPHFKFRRQIETDLPD